MCVFAYSLKSRRNQYKNECLPGSIYTQDCLRVHIEGADLHARGTHTHALTRAQNEELMKKVHIYLNVCVLQLPWFNATTISLQCILNNIQL